MMTALPDKRILIVTRHFPFPPIRGISGWMFDIVRRLHEVGRKVDLVSLVDEPVEARQIETMSRFCDSVSTVEHPLHKGGLGALGYRFIARMRGRRFGDIIDCPLGLRKAVRRLIATSRPDVAIVLSLLGGCARWLPRDMLRIIACIDLYFDKYEKYKRIGEESRVPEFADKDSEVRVLREYDYIMTITERDRNLLEGLVPLERVIAAPPSVRIIEYDSPDVGTDFRLEERHPNILFVGGPGYQNESGLRWFLEKVYPFAKEEVSDLLLYVVGDMPGVRGGTEERAIRWLGVLEGARLRLAYEISDVVVAPLVVGAGLKFKVLEAMAFGKPVVTTSIGEEGFGVVSGEHAYVADSPGEFAGRVVELLSDLAARRKMGSKARAFVEERFSPESSYGALLRLIAGAG